MSSSDLDTVMHVALTLFGADSAALAADGIAPGEWGDWDGSEEQAATCGWRRISSSTA